MKPIKIFIGAVTLFVISTLQAQPVAKTGYFMDNATHRHLLNPALIPGQGYFSIPALGSFDFDLKSNMRLNQFLYPGATANDQLVTFMHESVTPEQFLSQLSDVNFLQMSPRISLLSFGAFFGKSFWTFDVATRMNAGVTIPKELFSFLKLGMSSAAGNRYEINNLKLGADVLGEVSLGTSYPIGENIRVGGKAKILLGVARAEAGLEQMIIDMRPEIWTVSSKGVMDIHADGLSFTTDTDGFVDGVDGTPAGLAGSGFAFDLGVSWQPLEFLEVSAGILDLGSVGWKKELNRVAKAEGTSTFSGLSSLNLDDDSEEDPFAEFADGFMEMAQFKEVNISENKSTPLAPIINLGVEGKVLNDMLSLGLLYSNRMIPDNNIHEFSGIVNFRPLSLINLAASYSVINGSQSAFGLGMGLNFYLATLYLACDYIPTKVATGIPIPVNMASTHVQLGLSINLGKMKQ